MKLIPRLAELEGWLFEILFAVRLVVGSDEVRLLEVAVGFSV